MTNQKHEILYMEEAKLTPKRIESAIRRLPVLAQQKMESVTALATIDEISRSIAECTTIELGKYYDNKIDALAALARILKDDKIAVEAKRAKLLNYRKLGEIAESLRPTKTLRTAADKEEQRTRTRKMQARYKARKKGEQIPLRSTPAPAGALSLLREQGFTPQRGSQILSISRVPEDEFNRAISSHKPPGPAALAVAGAGLGRVSGPKISGDAYRKFRASRSGGDAGSFLYFCRKNDPAELARGMSSDEAGKARETVIELQEWLDTFERHLPK